MSSRISEWVSEIKKQDPSKFSAWRMGLSMCSTWSWGASIAVGIAIMHSMGFLAFLGWTFGNILAIPFFGFVRTKIPHTEKWVQFTPFILLFAFIHFFAIVMNLSALQGALGGGTDLQTTVALLPSEFILPSVMGVGLLTVGFIHLTKLNGSIFTDVLQYGLQVAGAVGIIVAGFLIDGRPDIVLETAEGFSWLPTAFLGIITGVTASGMQWQRIEALKSKKKQWHASLWGGTFFGGYMVLVTIAGLLFVGGFWQSLFLLAVIIGVATSTTDSGAAGQYFVADKFGIKGIYASLVSLAAVVAYPFVAKLGLVQIWGIYAGVRWRIVTGFILLTLLYAVTRYKVNYTPVTNLLKKTKVILKE